MDETRKKMGKPDDITTYHTGTYDSESWNYWSRGLIITWSWGRYISGCEKSTFTFSAFKPTETELISIETFNKDCMTCP